MVVLEFPAAIVTQSGRPDNLDKVVLSDTKEETLIQVLSDIKKRHGSIGGFVHLHPVNDKPSGIDSVFKHSEKEILKTVFFLAKHLKNELVEASQSGRSCFLSLTRMNGKLGFADPSAYSVIAGGLSGLIKTVRIEWGSVFCRSLDFEPKASHQFIMNSLKDELVDPDLRLTEIAYSTSGRSTLSADVENFDIEQIATEAIDSSSVFLVAGGAKGVTASCIKQLAQRFQPSFILLGRSDNSIPEPDWSRGVDDETELKMRCMEAFKAEGEKPTPVKITNRLKPILAQREINQTISDLQAAGSTVEYFSADILDTASLKKKLQVVVKNLGNITGIVHGAGVLADKLITEKTVKDYQMVFDTKVEGLQSLIQAVDNNKLKHLVLFSSAAGFYGNEAQSDYAVANEILNKFAHHFKQKHAGCHVVSFNWGPWDGGMVTPQLKRMFEERKIKVIPPEVGSSIMADELALKDKSAVQLVVGSSMVIPRDAGPELCSYNLSRSLSLEDNPFLTHHVIGNEPVLPIICALSWMADSCEKLYPGYQFVACKETKVLKGIVFNESAPQEYQVTIDELDKSEPGRILFQVQVSSEKAGKTVFHYSSKIRLARKHQQPLSLNSFNLNDSTVKAGADFYSDGTLFHDPIFQIVTRQQNIDKKRLTLACQAPKLTRRQKGQFHSDTFNSFADDVLLQALLIWVRNSFQAASLPLSIGEGNLYATTPFDEPFFVTMDVTSASENKLVATVCSHDEQGRVYTQLKNAEVIISKALNDKFMKN
ncbi:MAG: SDR family NAD(P)-dependent oxidoreductase [Proteobacteria bacterium]|nr:SDR family NAD(P)-dependent oxidoreductase [Pseudomonadota bacterium]